MCKARLLSSPHFMEMNTEVIYRGENFDKGLPVTLRNQILNPSTPPAAMYPVAQCIVTVQNHREERVICWSKVGTQLSLGAVLLIPVCTLERVV